MALVVGCLCIKILAKFKCFLLFANHPIPGYRYTDSSLDAGVLLSQNI